MSICVTVDNMLSTDVALPDPTKQALADESTGSAMIRRHIAAPFRCLLAAMRAGGEYIASTLELCLPTRSLKSEDVSEARFRLFPH